MHERITFVTKDLSRKGHQSCKAIIQVASIKSLTFLIAYRQIQANLLTTPPLHAATATVYSPITGCMHNGTIKFGKRTACTMLTHLTPRPHFGGVT